MSSPVISKKLKILILLLDRQLARRLTTRHARPSTHAPASQNKLQRHSLIALPLRSLVEYFAGVIHQEDIIQTLTANNALMSFVCRQQQLQFVTWTSASLLKHHQPFVLLPCSIQSPSPKCAIKASALT